MPELIESTFHGESSKGSLALDARTAALVRLVASAEGRGGDITGIVDDMLRVYVRCRHPDWQIFDDGGTEFVAAQQHRSLRVSGKTRLRRHRERFLKAWCAAYGVQDPREAVLVERASPNGDIEVYFRHADTNKRRNMVLDALTRLRGDVRRKLANAAGDPIALQARLAAIEEAIVTVEALA